MKGFAFARYTHGGSVALLLVLKYGVYSGTGVDPVNNNALFFFFFFFFFNPDMW